jgi:hypothetical protein
MRHTAKWHAEQAKKQERELQRLVWPNGPPRGQGSAAERIYPNLARNSTANTPRRGPQVAPKPNVASIIYPHLPRAR